MGRNKLEQKGFPENPFSHKVIIHLNVFGTSMEDRIRSNGQSTNIIKITQED